MSREGTCEISLVFSPVGNKPAERLFLYSIGSSSSSAAHAFMQWEVRCKWSETMVYKFEALKEDGMLTPQAKRFVRSSKPEHNVECKSPSCPEWLYQGIMEVLSMLDGAETNYTIRLGSFDLSYDQVMHVFDRVNTPTSYDTMDNNCQTWIVDFLRALSVPIPEHLRTIAQQVPLANDGGQLYHVVSRIVADVFESVKEGTLTTAITNIADNKTILSAMATKPL